MLRPLSLPLSAFLTRKGRTRLSVSDFSNIPTCETVSKNVRLQTPKGESMCVSCQVHEESGFSTRLTWRFQTFFFLCELATRSMC